MAENGKRTGANRGSLDEALGEVAKSGPAERGFDPAADELADELEPGGREAGEVAARTVRLALIRARTVIWGVTKVEAYVKAALEERLASVPGEQVTTPNPRIFFPAMQTLIYAGEEETIKEMLANLMAADFTVDGKKQAHPAFIEIIKEMTATDVHILSLLKQNGTQMYFEARLREKGQNNWKEGATVRALTIKVDDTDFNTIYVSLSNLVRLGMVTLKTEWPVKDEFERIEREFLERARKEKAAMELADTHEYSISKQGIWLTNFGAAFTAVCT